ncbi:MAG TPA: hypothetical protein VM286_10640 [Candidatus Thermoplasmatota archaeon]|nr:hypothetical protein [Candidatus Thermoplasmatota archaeon]
MRKATWGAILLGIFALTFGSPIREVRVLHEILSFAGLAGYILLSLDPMFAGPRHRAFLIAGVVAGLVSFLLVITGVPGAAFAARVLAVATVALPLWLAAGPAQFLFVAAAALALFTALPGVGTNLYTTSVHAYLAAAGALWTAWRLHAPGAMPWTKERKPKRMVVASNIITLTPAEKAARLARIEARYNAGEIPEHKYWDLRQEVESR